MFSSFLIKTLKSSLFTGAFLFSTLVFANEELIKVSGPNSILDLRYNTEQNFLKKNVYKDFCLETCYVHPDLYPALQKVEKILTQKKLKLVFWDCWRPLKVQEAMWKLVPNPRYVADPKQGSNHNRGVAIDVTLAKQDGTYLDMPTSFDDFTPKASTIYQCSNDEKQKCKNRDLLIRLMKQVGLEVLPTEWWHFQIPGAEKYPIISDFSKSK